MIPSGGMLPARLGMTMGGVRVSDVLGGGGGGHQEGGGTEMM